VKWTEDKLFNNGLSSLAKAPFSTIVTPFVCIKVRHHLHLSVSLMFLLLFRSMNKQENQRRISLSYKDGLIAGYKNIAEQISRRRAKKKPACFQTGFCAFQAGVTSLF
jgi:hypothetical protein